MKKKTRIKPTNLSQKTLRDFLQDKILKMPMVFRNFFRCANGDVVDLTRTKDWVTANYWNVPHDQRLPEIYYNQVINNLSDVMMTGLLPPWWPEMGAIEGPIRAMMPMNDWLERYGIPPFTHREVLEGDITSVTEWDQYGFRLLQDLENQHPGGRHGAYWENYAMRRRALSDLTNIQFIPHDWDDTEEANQAGTDMMDFLEQIGRL
jgi:hypothetical protein